VLKIEEKELIVSVELKRKIEIICRFANAKPIFFNGGIVNIKGTNIAYLEPHQVIIEDITYLLFEEYDYVFIENLDKKIKLCEFKEHLKKMSLTKFSIMLYNRNR